MRLLAFWLSVLVAQSVQAQLERRPCPGLAQDATVEKQAVCWFEREQGADGACKVDKEGVSDCTRQTTAWCGAAAMDDINVINTCFLAHLRAGQFQEARSLERYLEKPDADVAKCYKALTSTVVKVRSTPVAAEVIVEGISYGKTPIKLKLDGDWWKDTGNIVARFGRGKNASEVAISPRQLLTVFDRQSCVMGELTIKAPEAEISPARVIEATDSADGDAPAHGHVDRKKISLPGVISVAVGGAGIVTGGVLLAVALTRSSELSSPEKGTPWDQSHKDTYKSVKPLSAGGWVGLGVGTALVAVGVALITSTSGSSEENATHEANRALRWVGKTVNWTERF